MKYHELEKKLREAGCYPLGKNKRVKHPVWFSPITNHTFVTSHHGSEEVKLKTLKSILADAGVNL